MYQFHTARKGVSAAQLARELGITPASAWFMMHRLREAMDPGIEPLSGVIEVDEAFVGGLEKNKHSKKKLHKNWIEGKQIVLGCENANDGRIVLRPIHSGKKQPSWTRSDLPFNPARPYTPMKVIPSPASSYGIAMKL